MTPNSNILDLQNLLDRAIAICTEAIDDSEGKSFWYYSQEAFPFFVARIGELDVTYTDGEDIATYTFKLYVRYITGNRTAGLTQLGEGEALLYAGLPVLINAFLSSGLLQSEAFQDAPDWLQAVTLLPCPGLQSYDAAAIGGTGQQLGTTFTLDCEARVQIDLSYE